MNERIQLIVDTSNKADYHHLTIQNNTNTNTNDKEAKLTNNRFLSSSKQHTIKLPDVNVKIIEDDDDIVKECVYYYKNYKISSNYIKYVEKSHDELDKEIEYDMDEEDVCWLNIVNERRRQESLNEVSVDQFEMLIDRLEKESYFQSSPSSSPSKNNNNNNKNEKKKQSKKDKKHKTNDDDHDNAEEDDDVICCICLDGECVNSNAILFCDMCNLAVHQECYGVPYIPEGQWLCRRCIQSPSAPVSCCLCPNSEFGAFKQTDKGKWAHMVCAIWIPEVHFANTVFLEPICGIETIDKARWKLLCYICKKRGQGACIQCDRSNCYTAFHVTCGQQAGLYMNIVQQRLDASICSDDQSLSSSTASNAHSIGDVRKVAYCHAHAPIDDKVYFESDEEAAAELDDLQLTETTNKRKTLNGNKKAMSKEAAIKRAQRIRMKRARKIMSIMRKSNQNQLIMMPHVDQSSIDRILHRVNFAKKQQFFQLLMNYWLLKRQSRNGVPLIRRLQSAPIRKRLTTDKQQDSTNSTTIETTALAEVPETTPVPPPPPPPTTTTATSKDENMTAAATSSAAATTSNCLTATTTATNTSNALAPISTNFNTPSSLNNHKNNRLNQMRNQFFYWKRLRQDLERARLLLELIRKREKIKRENVKIHEKMVKYQLKPFQIFLNYILDQFRDFDKMRIFHEPVSRIDVPNYYEIIKSPMDFHTMSVKINENKYANFDQFERDFQLIIQNCLHFNEKDSFYYKAAIKLKDQASPILRRAKSRYEDVGYDMPSGLHAELNGGGSEQQTDVESLLNSEISNDISLERKLQILLDRLDLANTIKHAGARSKWASHLKAEINLIKRKISAHISTPTKSTPTKRLELDNQNVKTSTNTPLQQQSIMKYTTKQNINNNTNHNRNHNENDNSNRNW